MRTAVEILQTFWGYDQFRPPQAEIISDVLNKQDVVALLPTGSGKSLCFQIPTLVLEEGVCIVISPLIALMNDQVESLQKKGIKALALTGSISQNELIRIFDNLKYGGIRFLYLSPERLKSTFIQEKIKQLAVNLIAIDEAHCISEWGHDFRPSYLNLSILRELQPEANIIALTATATKRVGDDIISYLHLKNEKFYKISSLREKLHLRVIDSPDKLGNLLALIQGIQEPIIVYAGSRRNCQRTNDFLISKNISSVFYHAGLSKEVKDESYSKWYSEKAQVMVATNAFGMGIDKANVRMVVHLSLPYSLENYIQEVGRAGRDGYKAHAVIIEELADIEKKHAYYTKSLPTVDFIKDLYNNLNQYFHISYGTLPNETFAFQLPQFCKQYSLPIINSYNGLAFLEREEIIEMNSINKSKSQVVFTAKQEQLFSYYTRNAKKESILKNLLRSYEGIIETARIVNIDKLAKKLAISESKLIRELQEIDKDGIIKFQSGKTDVSMRFMKPREDAYTLSPLIQNLKQQQRIKKEKYRDMLRYLVTTDQCRNRIIQTYFDEDRIEDCGVCDICMAKKNQKPLDKKALQKAIIDILKNTSLSSKEIISSIGMNEDVIIHALRYLLDTNTIVLTSQNKYKLNEA